MERYINNLETVQSNSGAYIDKLNNKLLKHWAIEPDGTVGIDHAETIKSADYFIGSWLTAKKPGVILTSPTGTAKSAFNTGDIVGRIYSYVQDSGKVYWQLEDKNGGPSGGFVIHEPGRYDTKVALDGASGKAHEELMTELKKDDVVTGTVKSLGTGVTDVVKGAGETLSGIGKTLPWIIGLIIVAVLFLGFNKAKTL